MKDIKLKGWIARDKADTDVFFSEIALYQRRPKLIEDFYEDAGGFTETLFGSLDKYKRHLKKGECKKVEIIIREIK